jgi:hypothetical protein
MLLRRNSRRFSTGPCARGCLPPPFLWSNPLDDFAFLRSRASRNLRLVPSSGAESDRDFDAAMTAA